VVRQKFDALQAERRVVIPFERDSGTKKVDPVMLPPGRARLVTIPMATISPAVAATIGIVAVGMLGGFLQPVKWVRTLDPGHDACTDVA
jgi:hypothetical protein